MGNKLVIGMDFGTDSARGLLIDPIANKVLAKSVAYYTRWKQGLYCDPSKDQYRQHPLDYMEAIDEVLTGLLDGISAEERLNIVAIGTNTTGSTPVALDKDCTPLALKQPFSENPNAMFILWKDHTAVREAEEINALSKKWSVDFTKYSGGIYSSEWFWSKILHVNRRDKAVMNATYTWVEQSDWIPMYLAGIKHFEDIKRNRCAAGHKAMWAEEHGGLPSSEFLCSLDPTFYHLVSRLYRHTYTSDQLIGKIAPYFVDKFGLSEDLSVNVGAIDAHHGAVGSGIQPYTLVKVVGTSTCDMFVLPVGESSSVVEGICGQVDGSILPGMVGYEAGQSAFGDIYHWFKKILLEPTIAVLGDELTENQRQKLNDNLLNHLSKEAEQLPVTADDLVFTDYHNGRRTPDADFTLRAGAYGFGLGTTAVHVFKALVEATAFGSKAILERFRESEVPVRRVLATGGIPSKSPYVVQVLADVLETEIDVVDNDQTCALGSAVFAGVVAGLYADVGTAQQQIGAQVVRTFAPRHEYVEKYQGLYEKYVALTKIKL